MPEFQVHIDALKLSKEFEKYLTVDLGFWRSDFLGHPEGAEALSHPITLPRRPRRAPSFVFSSIGC